jgi:hypothetical protein
MGDKMLWKQGLNWHQYSVSEELARNWVTLLGSESRSVEPGSRWHKRTSKSSGFPWGEVTNGALRITVGAFTRESQHASGTAPATFHLVLAYPATAAGLAKEIDDILQRHNARRENTQAVGAMNGACVSKREGNDEIEGR